MHWEYRLNSDLRFMTPIAKQKGSTINTRCYRGEKALKHCSIGRSDTRKVQNRDS